jgi:hypothetical protein
MDRNTNRQGKDAPNKEKQYSIMPDAVSAAAATSSSGTAATDSRIPAGDYYGEYYGHRVVHLEQLLPALRATSDAIVWTAGDSSLDNKYWLPDSDLVDAVGAYRSVLDPPQSKPDSTYWLNHILIERQQQQEQPALLPQHQEFNSQRRRRYAAINAAVEATTTNERTYQLRAQDVFLRDNIRSDDILIVSVGGNDVALRPLPCTIASMLCLMRCCNCCACDSTLCIEHGVTCGSVPCDDRCHGFGPSLCSCLCAFPPCLGYFRHLFGTRVQRYIDRLTAKTQPAKILVCMIYYPDENATHRGWAGPALTALGYDTHPDRVQALIRKGYTDFLPAATAGSGAIPVPLFHVLNGKNTDDYVARVEPSSQGGRKIAEFLLDIIRRSDSGGNLNSTSTTASSAVPSVALIQGRN